MSAREGLITAEQLSTMARSRRVELVRGELVEMTPVGGRHGDIVLEFGATLRQFVRKHRLGFVGTDVGVVLTRDPDIVRGPDLVFIAAPRVPAGEFEGFFEGAPDLAVEVNSPGDRAGDVQQKVREYLEHGTRLVWLIDPRSRTVTVFRPDGSARIYTSGQEVPGEDVIPGFSFRVSGLFEE